MPRPRAAHALLLLPLVGIAAWLVVRGRTVRDDPGTVLAALRAAAGPALPAARAAGATARSEPASYTRETLYEYIDGAAEAYLARGFEQCLTATYTFAAAAGSLDVTAEVYRFAKAADAEHQMQAERPADAAPLAGVAGAFADSSTLVATRGADYLKLTALAAGDDAARAMAGIAAAWRQDRP